MIIKKLEWTRTSENYWHIETPFECGRIMKYGDEYSLKIGTHDDFDDFESKSLRLCMEHFEDNFRECVKYFLQNSVLNHEQIPLEFL